MIHGTGKISKKKRRMIMSSWILTGEAKGMNEWKAD